MVANFESRKQELLKNKGLEVKDSDYKEYASLLISSLSSEEQTDLIEVLEKFSGSIISEMSGIDIVQALNQCGADSIGGKQIYDIQIEFFSKEILTPELKEKFLDQAKSVYGTEKQGNVVPGSFFTITEGFVELARSLVENLKDGRFKFIGRGSNGLVIQIEQDDLNSVLKLSMPPRESLMGGAFKGELDDIKSYERQKKYPLVEIPELVYDNNGEAIADSGAYILKKFQSGEMINDGNCSGSYVNLGLSDEFLLQYIQFFSEYAREGIDLGDVSPDNYFYQPEKCALSFFEIGANIDNLQQQEHKELLQEHPLAATVHSLMTKILLFESADDKFNKLKQDVNLKAKEQWGIENLFEHRLAQLIKVLNQVVKDPQIDIGVEELREELQFLSGEGQKFPLSQKGQEYLDFIINEVNAMDFDNRSYH